MSGISNQSHSWIFHRGGASTTIGPGEEFENSLIADIKSMAWLRSASKGDFGKAYLVGERLVLVAAEFLKDDFNKPANKLELRKITVIFAAKADDGIGLENEETHEIKKIMVSSEEYHGSIGNWALLKLKSTVHDRAERLPSFEISQSIINEIDFLSLFIESANGSASAQFRLGDYYSQHRDFKKALKWYLKAAQQNYSDAKWSLYLLFASSKTGIGDVFNRDRWLQEYIDDGVRFYYGVGIGQNISKATQIFRNAARINNMRAREYLERIKNDELERSQKSQRELPILTNDANAELILTTSVINQP